MPPKWMEWKMKITNPAIKTVKERLNNTAENFFYGTHILGLQPRDKAAMLGVNTIREILHEKFTWK